MALNALKCNHLASLGLKGLRENTLAQSHTQPKPKPKPICSILPVRTVHMSVGSAFMTVLNCGTQYSRNNYSDSVPAYYPDSHHCPADVY